MATTVTMNTTLLSLYMLVLVYATEKHAVLKRADDVSALSLERVVDQQAALMQALQARVTETESRIQELERGQRKKVTSCPEGWPRFNSSCFAVGDDPMNWGDAAEVCERFGGRLADFESSEENEFGKELARSHKLSAAWLDGTDMFFEDHWIWTNSKKVISSGFSDWQASEVESHGGDCLVLWQPFDYKWGDYPCNADLPFICEITRTRYVMSYHYTPSAASSRPQPFSFVKWIAMAVTISILLLLALCVPVYTTEEHPVFKKSYDPNAPSLERVVQQQAAVIQTLLARVAETENKIQALESCQQKQVTSCPDGWQQFNSSCYAVGDGPMSWGDAAEVCERSGGRLADIESSEENTFVKGLVRSHSHPLSAAWIDGADIFVEDHWVWMTSGKVISSGFSDWVPTEVGSHGGDCLVLWRASNYRWGDYPCSVTLPFVCEITLG